MKLGLLALAASAMIAGSARAAIYTEYFYGTVSGVDTLGILGTAGATLDTSYVETVRIDTSKGVSNGNSYFAHIYDDGLSDPVTADLTIGGVSLVFGVGAAQLGNPYPPYNGGLITAFVDGESGKYLTQLQTEIYTDITPNGFPRHSVNRIMS